MLIATLQFWPATDAVHTPDMLSLDISGALAAIWSFIGGFVAPGAVGNWPGLVAVGGGNSFCETEGVGVAGNGCGSGSSSLPKREL
jgi:hypothetical protein